MAFNMSAFLGGAATGVVKRIDDMERKAEKKADRAYTASEKDRLYSRAKRDKENAITKELTEKLSVFYTPDQVPDIMSNGVAAARYAISRGEYYTNNNMKAHLQYQMPNNDITNISAAPVGSVGDVAKASEELSSGPPEGLGGGSFASRLTGNITPEYETMANAQIDVLNMRIKAARLSDGEAKEKLLKDADLTETISLDMARKESEARREGGDSDPKAYTASHLFSLEKRSDTIALNEMGVETGQLGELGKKVAEKLRGSNTMAMSYLRSADALNIRNNKGPKDEGMYQLIDGKKDIAVNNLQAYVTGNYNKIIKANVYANVDAAKNAAKVGGNLKPGTMYAYFKPAYVKMVDGKEVSVPDTYVAGTFIGDNYQANLGLDGLQNAISLPSTWLPK